MCRLVPDDRVVLGTNTNCEPKKLTVGVVKLFAVAIASVGSEREKINGALGIVEAVIDGTAEFTVLDVVVTIGKKRGVSLPVICAVEIGDCAMTRVVRDMELTTRDRRYIRVCARK
jgi:hypothetical protein